MPTLTASANTPSGAITKIQPTSTSMASFTASNRLTRLRRRSSSSLVAASANTAMKVTTGSMSPLASESKMLAGTRLSSHLPRSILMSPAGAAPALLATIAAAAAGGAGHQSSSKGTKIIDHRAEKIRSARNASSARPATLPPPAWPTDCAMPVNSRPAISGMIVICNACSHRLPMASVTGSSGLPMSAGSNAPTTSPVSSARKIRSVRFICLPPAPSTCPW